ncbi:MAG: hypothetical protein HKN58_04720 [Xanthomonadales bacterium]|nr:hypothetical protein [Xanthomonadales bacterium]
MADALLKLGLPVAGLTFALVWWALRKGVVSEVDTLQALSKQIEAMSKKKDKDTPREKINPVHDKWLKFGGGFYGTVALYTFALIEWPDLVESFSGLGELLRSNVSAAIGILIGAIVEAIIESIMNFVAAIAWPVYWMSEFGASRMWLWMAIAYGGYWLGLQTAQYAIRSRR